ncbi:uncharacterized protein LOC124934548 [Impatiens glandulifera]|uniref:uncharacterized protein LOC124934548 n=1 Tax=Impatiens glandulifera TaxID=253017 RepID=UPI001FB0A453|nr:uncharacterized protein LOC124934548 [Impatiens glandulifera]
MSSIERHHQSTRTSQSGSLIEKTNVTSSSESDDLKRLEHTPHRKRALSKNLSMCQTPRDVAWEKRRIQILNQERNCKINETEDNLTDEDLSELRGSIELGFGFNEEGVLKKPGGRRLCNTLPALDLYFAVNRQFATSPVTSPRSQISSQISCLSSTSSSSSLIGSPNSNSDDSWKICSPGDSPQQVKTKLRHWAQAVACSVRQSY